MAKKDFDIDFDFDEAYGFDAKSFSGDTAYDDSVDGADFTDEELGLSPGDNSSDKDDFDLDGDLDDFLNMGEESQQSWQEPEQDGCQDDAASQEPEEEVPGQYAGEEAYDEEPQYDEDATGGYAGEYDESYDEDVEEAPKKEKKPRKPIKLPKLPKLKTPNIFTRFFDLYFGPVLHKEQREEPVDPDNPRRRRRKSRSQIFKEVYLPPLLVCVCLIMVLTFVIGSLSNVIERHQIDKQNQQSQLDASISQAEQLAAQGEQVLTEAEALAAGYDYDKAIEKLESIGDLTQHPEVAAKRAEYENAKNSLIEYKDPTLIPNLSFHVLIEDMTRAKQDAELGGSYNKNFVTTGEFSKILNQLYTNGYVLVDFNSFIAANTDLDGNQKFMIDPILLPEGKKPVMLTETMVNYFEYMVDSDGDHKADAKGDGFANKLVVDGNGDIKAEYIDAAGQTLVGNYDFVPILEDFIAEHPDFCYRGARAILAVTGHEGVFGYRCNTSYISTISQQYYDEQVAGAKAIADALRDKGYTIACFTYKNDAYGKLSVAQIQADMQSWTSQVVNVIGPVDTFVFARASRLTEYGASSNAFQVMYTSGFRYFISNDATPYTEVNDTYVRQNRLMVTGENMQHKSSMFTGLFDTNAVLELNTRGSVPTG